MTGGPGARTDPDPADGVSAGPGRAEAGSVQALANRTGGGGVGVTGAGAIGWVPWTW